MKLSLYGSASFRRHLEPQIKEEIIGDVYVTFNFIIPKTVVMTAPPKVVLESSKKRQESSIQTANQG